MSDIKILGYQGVSWVSKIIRWQTRSKYSHIAIMLPDKTTIEAWMVGGDRWLKGKVVHRDNFSIGHTDGTKVTVFDIVDPEFDDIKALEYLFKQVGKPYDWKSVLRFLTHLPASVNGKLFCSEVAEEMGVDNGHPFHNELSIPANMSPEDTATSIGLKPSGELIVNNK